MEIGIILTWVVLSFAVSVFASKNGRIGFIAFLWSLLLSPLLVFVIYAVLGATPEKRAERIFEEESIRAEARRRLGG